MPTSILDLFKLDGRAALVTGAAQGLGQAMALALADADLDRRLTAYKQSLAEKVEQAAARVEQHK